MLAQKQIARGECELVQREAPINILRRYREYKVEREYSERLTILIDSLLDNSQGLGFWPLVRSLDGAFPVSVHCILRARKHYSAESPAPDYSRSLYWWEELLPPKALPPPHRANYDWRYTPHSATATAARISSALGGAPSRVCFLGSPFLAVDFYTQHPQCHVTVLDINGPLMAVLQRGFSNSTFQFMTYDVQEPLPPNLSEQFDAVVMDPPWYLDYYWLFLSRGLELLSNNKGSIFTTLFPPMCRRNATEDMSVLGRFFETTAGLKTISRGDIVYETPKFEFEVFRANDVPGDSRQWRRADFVELNFTQTTSPPCTGSWRLESQSWTNLVHGDTALAIDTNSVASEVAATGTFENQIVCTQLLSISRREIAREHFYIWDSNNRVTYRQSLGLTGTSVVVSP